MTRNAKRDVFIVADGSQWPDTEAGLLDRLDAEEAYLLKHHPLIDNGVWRSLANLTLDMQQEQMAVQAMDRLRALRDALQNPEITAWQAASLAMKFQDMVAIYRQPVTQSETGRSNANKRAAPKPNDELTMLVMRYLRNQGKPWKEVLRALETAASNEGMIADVEIQQIGDRFYFTQQHAGKLDQVEDFTVSTLQRKKFSKAR